MYRREDADRISIDDPERALHEHQRASLAYLLWPVALYEQIVERATASRWYRYHIGQAFLFGAFGVAAAVLALSWPLVLALLLGNVPATLAIYAVAILLDAALFFAWLAAAIAYGKKAARGEAFEIRFLGALTRRLSAKR